MLSIFSNYVRLYLLSFFCFWVKVKNEFHAVNSLPKILISTGPLLSDFQKPSRTNTEAHKIQGRLEATKLRFPNLSVLVVNTNVK